MRISDWSSDVCSSDLLGTHAPADGGDILDALRLIGARLLGGAVLAQPAAAQVGDVLGRDRQALALGHQARQRGRNSGYHAGVLSVHLEKRVFYRPGLSARKRVG